MKTYKMRSLSKSVMVVATLLATSCSLEPTINAPSGITAPAKDAPPPPGTLDQVYNQLNALVGQYGWHAMNEHTTDEFMGPTRGTDWDDFGTWRKLHLHTWDGSHNQVNDTWSNLQSGMFQSTLVAETGTGTTAAEARFLRAFFVYHQLDLYGQVQYRAATANALEIPKVYTRAEAIEYLITELEATIPSLPDFNGANRKQATKEAAKFLLAKAYLNKAVYKQDPTAPAGPFAFDAADMNKVIQNVDDIVSNSNLSVAANYWDNFTWQNGSKSTENIFVRPNSGGINVVWYDCMGGHYNMAPSGWNGFTTLSDFYNSFENGDARKGVALSGYSEFTGRNVGFLVGQIQGPEKVSGGTTTHKIGDPIVDLKDRSGNPLVFTPDASLFFSTETKGIRTNKYPLDPNTINDGGWSSANDFAFFRLSDAKLMKAEAILRGGTATGGETPVSLVNSIRANRGVADLATVDLTALLAERGRELYLEGWRRNDLVRFEKFNQPVIERDQASDPSRVVFPIPNIALSSNPNLKQNFGY